MSIEKSNHVYILRCKDGTLYTGWTNDLERRLLAHNTGAGAKYTRMRLPAELVFSEAFETRGEAQRRECGIKRMSRVKKLELIKEAKQMELPELPDRNKTYIIQTPRLGLRRWIASDLQPFFELNSDQNVMEFFPKTLSKEESDAFVERIEKGIDERGFGFYAVDLLENNEFIGMVGLGVPNFEADFMPCVEIGWRLKKDAWGKGYASEAASACLDYAFNELGIAEIVSFTAEINLPSQGVMKKIGMKKASEFLHPRVAVGHALSKHILYKIVQ